MTNCITLHQSYYGIIKGYRRSDDYYWIECFYVYPEYRGQGFARLLAQYLPLKCKLEAFPILALDQEPKLELDALIDFYQSIGFYLRHETAHDTYMIRN